MGKIRNIDQEYFVRGRDEKDGRSCGWSGNGRNCARAIEGKTRSRSVFEPRLGRMGKRSEREERQERRNVSFSGAEERVAPFESAVRSFFPSSTWPPCVPARRCSDCKMRWLTYDSVPIPGEKDGDACVKTGSQLFNSRFAALVSLFLWFLEPATFNDTFYYVARRSAPPLPSILDIVPSLKDLPLPFQSNF